jgi:hypothetical protein
MSPTNDFTWHDSGPPLLDPVGRWVEVRGPALESPAWIQIAQTADERPIISTLVMGGGTEEQAHEITARVLRQFPPSQILRQIHDDGGLTRTGGAGRARKPRPGDLTPSLEQSAAVYREELLRAPFRATTATAKRLHVSRATIVRRLAQCRAEGLLPPKDTTKIKDEQP